MFDERRATWNAMCVDSGGKVAGTEGARSDSGWCFGILCVFVPILDDY